MQTTIYEATYEDAQGRETTHIYNDDEELRISLRGVDFTAMDFDGFEPIPEHLERAQSLFTLNRNELCACRLDWTMPLDVDLNGEICASILVATLELGSPASNGGIDAELLALELKTPHGIVRSSGRSGWFEDELLELSRGLGEGSRIRSCITCAFSDYGPGGHGLFGGLACFRDVKDEYRKVQGKTDIFALWDRKTEYVQETYLCPEYQLRKPGTGYRG